MNINKLSKRVKMEKDTGTATDGMGNHVADWQPLFTTWAEVRPLRGEEIETGLLKSQEVSHMVTMRYRKDFVRDKHRINYKGRILAIETIVNKDELNIELNITCREV